MCHPGFEILTFSIPHGSRICVVTLHYTICHLSLTKHPIFGTFCAFFSKKIQNTPNFAKWEHCIWNGNLSINTKNDEKVPQSCVINPCNLSTSEDPVSFTWLDWHQNDIMQKSKNSVCMYMLLLQICTAQRGTISWVSDQTNALKLINIKTSECGFDEILSIVCTLSWKEAIDGYRVNWKFCSVACIHISDFQNGFNFHWRANLLFENCIWFKHNHFQDESCQFQKHGQYVSIEHSIYHIQMFTIYSSLWISQKSCFNYTMYLIRLVSRRWSWLSTSGIIMLRKILVNILLINSIRYLVIGYIQFPYSS